MKGATAVPLVRTTRLPNNPTTMNTGSSQNFFRVRMYSQNSDKNSISSLVGVSPAPNRPIAQDLILARRAGGRNHSVVSGRFDGVFRKRRITFTCGSSVPSAREPRCGREWSVRKNCLDRAYLRGRGYCPHAHLIRRPFRFREPLCVDWPHVKDHLADCFVSGMWLSRTRFKSPAWVCSKRSSTGPVSCRAWLRS
jgi:hypothetical protein